ncbi:MAG: FKBP-type peptidyl-prolyl cis-trans isomerase [Rhodoferax sp.]|nr:FKBP-type peptidyl-prolyl cis-trans isomerase [Rhodoferax sp.]MDP3651431.1 FKBP-type peptidyl-prolyl cis-trans isomerase [Rhodoferax sp.]
MTTTLPLVQSDSFLTLHYRLGGPAGNAINTFDGKPATLTLGTGELSPALEAYLVGLEEGTRATFEVPAGAAFGERNPAMQQWLDAKVLREMGDPQESFRVGDVVEFPTPDGQGKFAGAVLQVRYSFGKDDLEAVLFDFNHPLAGQPVTFEVHVIGVL